MTLSFSNESKGPSKTEIGHRHKSSTRINRGLTAQIPVPGQSAWNLSGHQKIQNLRADQVLVETSCVGLNPFDWQSVVYGFGVTTEPRVVGRDGAGVVVAKGHDVDRFQIGDRVWYCANPALEGSGAFQDYSIHSASEISHTPHDMADEQAATLGSGLITAGIILLKTLGLPLQTLISGPTSVAVEKPWLLVWGGAGATGVFLIQLAHLLGYRVICAGSPVNHGYLKSLGADIVLDRWSEPSQLVHEIRAATNDRVILAVDNVGSQTATLCQQILEGSASWRRTHGIDTPSSDSPSARLVAIAGSPKPFPIHQDAVRTVESLRLSFSTTFFGHPEFSVPLLDCFADLLGAKRIQPSRLTVLPGGLDGILGGLEVLRHEGTAGYKMIYRVRDNGSDETVKTFTAREAFHSDVQVPVDIRHSVVA